MNRTSHLSDDTLILYIDGELEKEAAQRTELHLQSCGDCRRRLELLRLGSAAYGQYHKQVLKPVLQSSLPEWGRILDRLTRETKSRSHSVWSPPFAWAAAVIAVCLILASIYFRQHPGRVKAGELLARAAAVPETPHRTLLFSAGKHRWSRSARVQAGEGSTTVPAAERFAIQRVHALFVQANYSWDDPLSARSFARWRNHLSEKRDQVTVIRGVGGARELYRLRTSTDAGILQAASLTLRADTYYSTDARFDFRGETPVQISEEPVQAVAAARRSSRADGMARPKPVETTATPEDELRVFAVLSAMNADAEEPIEVRMDAGHHRVVITATGLPRERQNAIGAALAELPGTVVHFNSGQPDRSNSPVRDHADSVSADDNSAFLKILEDLAGGPRELQLLTDKALDASNVLFAQAHSLAALANEFPPDTEAELSSSGHGVLLSLRKRHVLAMQNGTRQLGEELAPLIKNQLPATGGYSGASGASWQNRAKNLLQITRSFDQSLSRLLAGRYPQETGSEMLNRLPGDLLRLNNLIGEQTKLEP